MKLVNCYPTEMALNVLNRTSFVLLTWLICSNLHCSFGHLLKSTWQKSRSIRDLQDLLDVSFLIEGSLCVVIPSYVFC